jgi:hypothetical protein
MMGVPILGATFMFGNNLSVITNTSLPESMLKKKLNSICYHVVRESAAMEEIMTAWEPTLTNPADIATKIFARAEEMKKLERVQRVPKVSLVSTLAKIYLLPNMMN